MVWTDQHDTMLCREILTLNPFQSKKSSVQRGQIWHAIAVNLVSIRELHFKVDRRAVRDRYNLLSGKLRRKLKDEERASGIDTDMTETEVALEDLIEREDAAEAQLKENVDAGKKKKADDRESAEDMRAKALEKLGETQKRKAEGNELGKIKKRRSTGGEAVRFLREKNEMLASVKKEEMALKLKSEEAESKRHHDFMQMMYQQQQQQKEQMHGIQAMMLQQQQQQNQLIMTMLSKVMPK